MENLGALKFRDLPIIQRNFLPNSVVLFMLSADNDLINYLKI